MSSNTYMFSPKEKFTVYHILSKYFSVKKLIINIWLINIVINKYKILLLFIKTVFDTV